MSKKYISENDLRRKRVRHQLEEWVKGNAQHNSIDDECCPDFSCCRPELLVNEEIRKTFLAANQSQRESFLFSFLGAALSDKNVFIANGKDEINSVNN